MTLFCYHLWWIKIINDRLLPLSRWVSCTKWSWSKPGLGIIPSSSAEKAPVVEMLRIHVAGGAAAVIICIIVSSVSRHAPVRSTQPKPTDSSGVSSQRNARNLTKWRHYWIDQSQPPATAIDFFLNFQPWKLEFSWKENSSVPIGWSLRFLRELRSLRCVRCAGWKLCFSLSVWLTTNMQYFQRVAAGLVSAQPQLSLLSLADSPRPFFLINYRVCIRTFSNLYSPTKW